MHDDDHTGHVAAKLGKRFLSVFSSMKPSRIDRRSFADERSPRIAGISSIQFRTLQIYF
jgi:hypothetical protein